MPKVNRSYSKYKRVTASANFSLIQRKLARQLHKTKADLAQNLSDFLSDLSKNLIRFSPSTDNPRSKCATNTYVNNTRIYFTGEGIPQVPESQGNRVPSEVVGLSECLAVLRTLRIPNKISIMNNTVSDANGYGYWYNVEKIGWRRSGTIVGSRLISHRTPYVAPYHTFSRAWAATNRSVFKKSRKTSLGFKFSEHDSHTFNPETGK